MSKWLKKYTKACFLEDMLQSKTIFLGNPDDWADKNDSTLINIYKKKMRLHNIRATCLTMAADRYHFWEVFGEKEKGVCLWFDMNQLKEDILKDTNLISKPIIYLLPEKLEKCGEFKNLPFYKREQYRDEKEFRVLRKFQNKDDASNKCGFEFNPRSLKKIYLNSWLSPKEYKWQYNFIKSLLVDNLSHVDLQQNKVHDYKEWIYAAQNVTDRHN